MPLQVGGQEQQLLLKMLLEAERKGRNTLASTFFLASIFVSVSYSQAYLEIRKKKGGGVAGKCRMLGNGYESKQINIQYILA